MHTTRAKLIFFISFSILNAQTSASSTFKSTAYDYYDSACRVAQVGTYSIIAATSTLIGLYALVSQYQMTHCFVYGGMQTETFPAQEYSPSHFVGATIFNTVLALGACKTLAQFSIKKKLKDTAAGESYTYDYAHSSL